MSVLVNATRGLSLEIKRLLEMFNEREETLGNELGTKKEDTPDLRKSP